MYNVQINFAHNNQTHCHPPIPKTWIIKKIHQQIKIGKKKFTFQVWLKEVEFG
jgi:hypothetical protein